jgi:hypothetical protein
MRAIVLLSLVAALTTPLLAAAPATTQTAKPLLWIRVSFNGPQMDLGGNKTGFMVMGVETSAALESHVTSLEIINSEQTEAQTGKGRYTYTQYFIRLNLDAAGTAEVNKMIRIAKESDKRDNGQEGDPRVMLNDTTGAYLHLLPHDDRKTCELRLVVTDKQLLALSAAVRRVWKRPPNTTPSLDWTEGKIPTDPTP